MSRRYAECGIAEAARDGEQVSGDRFVVQEANGGMLVACVDGVGHGTEAAEVAAVAASVLETAAGQPVARLMSLCHEALRGTRGAVLIATWFDSATGVLTWSAVGELHGVLVRADPGAQPGRVVLLTRPGVVGRSLPTGGRPMVLHIQPGDTLLLATDGIREQFVEDRELRGEPARLAERILERHHRPDDDALVLAIRFRERRA